MSESSPQPFAVAVAHVDRVARVAPRGELDLATAAELERALKDVLDAGIERLALDLRGLDFIDSSGMAIMHRLHKRSIAHGFTFVVVRGPQQVQRVFSLVGLDHVFTFVDDFDELPRRE